MSLVARHWGAIRVALSVGLSTWLLVHLGVSSIAGALAHASPWWAIGALAAGMAATGVQTTQWRALLAANGLQRGWARCLRFVFVGNLFNALLPSSIGGDVVRVGIVADAAAERVAAAASVVLQRICNFPGMIVVLTAGLVATLSDPGAARARPAALAGGLIGVGLIAVCFGPAPARLGRVRWLGRSRAGRMAATLLGALGAFRGRRRELLAACLRGTAFWSLSVVNQWMFMHAVGLDVSIGYAAVVVTTINALTMLPVSINGYGIREGGFVLLLAGGSTASQSAALAAGLCLTGQSLLWALIGLACWVLPTRRPASSAQPAAAQAVS